MPKGRCVNRRILFFVVLDEHLYSCIAIDLPRDFMSDLKDGNGLALRNESLGRTVSMNAVSTGVKFGLTYYFVSL